MKRVKKGENYWYVTPTGFVSQTYDTGDLTDKLRFEFGNYFYTSGEAESMAKKLRAVLKGAEVIEMPSEEEISQQYELMDTLGVYHCSEDYREGYRDAIDFIKSKIVK